MHTHPQFSLRAALVAITLCCVALPGFTYAHVLWASAWFTLVLGWLFWAALTSLYSHGRVRAFWVGFLVTGFSYLTAVYGPVLDRRVGYWLLTTKSFSALELQLKRLSPSWRNVHEMTIEGGGQERSTDMLSLLERGAVGGLPQWASFQMVGRSLVAVILAWCGGLFAVATFRKYWRPPEDPTSISLMMQDTY